MRGFFRFFYSPSSSFWEGGGGGEGGGGFWFLFNFKGFFPSCRILSKHLPCWINSDVINQKYHATVGHVTPQQMDRCCLSFDFLGRCKMLETLLRMLQSSLFQCPSWSKWDPFQLLVSPPPYPPPQSRDPSRSFKCKMDSSADAGCSARCRRRQNKPKLTSDALLQIQRQLDKFKNKQRRSPTLPPFPSTSVSANNNHYNNNINNNNNSNNI